MVALNKGILRPASLRRLSKHFFNGLALLLQLLHHPDHQNPERACRRCPCVGAQVHRVASSLTTGARVAGDVR